MIPPTAFVAELEAHDPSLRVRFARHQAAFDKPLWIIERKLDGRSPPPLTQLRALDLSRSRLARACGHARHVVDCPRCRKAQSRARTMDLWEGAREGYIHVMNVHPTLLTWSQVAPSLAAADAWRQGGMEALARKYDEDDAQAERTQERHEARVIDQHLSGAWDHLQWREKRRISTYVPEGGGFVVTDRRAVTA